jgi:DNA-binding response OmpR family regulator
VRILIAEDDPFFRRLLQKLLAADFEVVTAEDGTGAWAMIQQNQLHQNQLHQNQAQLLAILDWVMPGLSGPQVCREVRANPATAGIYVILLTARNSPADILAGLRAGADDYITKPFEPEELRARVRVGRRIIELEQHLAGARRELESTALRARSLEIELASLRENRGGAEVAKGASA